MRSPFALAAIAALLPCGACGDGASAPPPYGEAIVVVDTDTAVPTLVDRLRVDVYSPDGATWLASQDFLRGDPSLWPTSFAVETEDEQSDHLALVRVRAYRGGRVRDYQGEVFAGRVDPSTICDEARCSTPTPATPPPACCPNAPPPTSRPFGDGPRVAAADGSDATPASEPLPSMAIDRLLLVRAHPGTVAAVRVVLRGACTGNMADLANLQTCVDTDGPLASVEESILDADTSLPATTLAGTFQAQPDPCTATPRARHTAADGTPLYDDEACIAGGAFVLGSDGEYGASLTGDWPPRLAIIPALRMDRYEVTVGRWRDALAHGFEPPNPLTLRGLGGDTAKVCTWTTAPSGLEDHPLLCVPWVSARAFCRLQGGDLPTEAQWEYVAGAAGRDAPTRFPWGDDEPTCARAAFGLGITGAPLGSEDFSCNLTGTAAGGGSLPVDARESASGDVALGTGVVDLGGNAEELVLDTAVPMTSMCWAAAGLTSPSCRLGTALGVVLRGGDWARNLVGTRVTDRGLTDTDRGAGLESGFRCVRSGAGP